MLLKLTCQCYCQYVYCNNHYHDASIIQPGYYSVSSACQHTLVPFVSQFFHRFHFFLLSLLMFDFALAFMLYLTAFSTVSFINVVGEHPLSFVSAQ